MSETSGSHKYGDISVINGYAHLGDKTIVLNIDCHDHHSLMTVEQAGSQEDLHMRQLVRAKSPSEFSESRPLSASHGADHREAEDYALNPQIFHPNLKRSRETTQDTSDSSACDCGSPPADSGTPDPDWQRSRKRVMARRNGTARRSVHRRSDLLSKLIYSDICDQLLNIPEVHPESYTISNVNGSILVCTILESLMNPDRKRMLMFYARTARSWERIVVDLIPESYTEVDADEMQVTAHTKSNEIKIPDSIGALVTSILPNCRMREGGTQLTLVYTADCIDGPLLTKFDTQPCASANEAALFEDEGVLEFARLNQCPFFKSGEVCVEARVSVYEYVVWVRSMTCYEYRFPFVTMGDFNNRRQEFRAYCDGIKLLLAMRNSSSTVQIHGIVLAEGGRTIRGFLKERPVIHSMHNFLLTMSFYGHIAPPALRGHWISDVVRAISDIHEAGKVLGFFKLSNIRVRRDGTAIFDPYFNNCGRAPLFDGNLPPELRSLRVSDRKAYELGIDDFNPATLWDQSMDIFVLGSVIWCIAEGCNRMNRLKLCARAACSNLTRYSCPADHADPVTLPPCTDRTLDWVDNLVNLCRHPNPEERASSKMLLQTLEDAHLSTTRDENQVSKVIELAEDFERRGVIISGFCDRCDNGFDRGEETHHCNTCNQGDFDLCGRCLAQGVHCWDVSHQLLKVTN